MNASLADTILNFLVPFFSSWGYVIVFAGIFLESIFLTGWIAPGSTVLLLGSFYAAQGELNLAQIAVIGVLAAFLGDNAGFFLGARYGERLLRKYHDHKRLCKGLEKTQGYFRRFGGVTVLFGRMISGVDAFIPLFAGLGGMRYRKYIAYDIPGIFLWVATLCTLGYVFGDNWEVIDRFFGIIGWCIFALVLVASAVYFFVKRRRKA
jgi:membrane-associated protein